MQFLIFILTEMLIPGEKAKGYKTSTFLTEICNQLSPSADFHLSHLQDYADDHPYNDQDESLNSHQYIGERGI